MDFDLHLNNQPSHSLVEKDTDPAKYDAIAAKLCDKRKALEERLSTSDLDPTIREEVALDLIQIKKDMDTFGISEIDYQAYLASKENKQETINTPSSSLKPQQEQETLVEPD